MSSNKSKAALSAEIKLMTQEYLKRGEQIQRCRDSKRGIPHQAGGPRDCYPVPHAQGHRWGNDKSGKTSDQSRYTGFRAGAPNINVSRIQARAAILAMPAEKDSDSDGDEGAPAIVVA